MHELAITQNMLDLVLEKAREAGASEVKKINLVVGEMTGIVEECVQFYFDFLGKETIAQGATLNFTKVPTRVRCRTCGNKFELKESYPTCPSCQDSKIEFIAGRELFVESIEVE